MTAPLRSPWKRACRLWRRRIRFPKKTAKLTGEALREMLFDVEWHCSDTDLAADGFQVLLLFPDEETRTFYGKSLRKMGIPYFRINFQIKGGTTCWKSEQRHRHFLCRTRTETCTRWRNTGERRSSSIFIQRQHSRLHQTGLRLRGPLSPVFREGRCRPWRQQGQRGLPQEI